MEIYVFGIRLYNLVSVFNTHREKYFMLGEPNERKEIDEETALEPDARSEAFLFLVSYCIVMRFFF